MSEVLDNLAKNLTKLRLDSGMTQAELAQRLNYTDKAVSKWEHGDTTPPIDVLKTLADIYGVSIDYLISDNEGADFYNKNESNYKKTNKIIITSLSVSLVWLLAVMIFSYALIGAWELKSPWKLFVYAVPISAIVLIVFNGIWGRRSFTFILVSILVWSLLTSIYVCFLDYNIWAVYLIGVPLQIAIILWSGLKSSRVTNKK